MDLSGKSAQTYEQLGNSQPSGHQPPPGYTAFQTTFACVSLHGSDRLRLLQFPNADVDSLRTVIQRSWGPGIQRERPYGGSHEFKLYRNPWYGQGSDAIPSRILMREILAHLFKGGWILHTGTDCSKKELDKDTLIFRKQQAPPPESEWVAISFNQTDRLRLIGPDDALILAMTELLRGMQLLQSQEWKDQRLQAWEYKLHGRPWWASGEKTMSTRLLILKMMEVLESQGWSLYASIDQSQGSDNSSETDSWFCVRDKNWTPGAAVFHR